MAVYHDPGPADEAILSLLENGDTADLATGGIFPVQVHDGADAPHVVFQCVSEPIAWSMGGGSLNAPISYLVRCVSAESPEEANNLAAAVISDLHDASPTIAGYTVLSLTLSGGGQRYPDDAGFYNATNYFRLWLYKNS